MTLDIRHDKYLVMGSLFCYFLFDLCLLRWIYIVLEFIMILCFVHTMRYSEKVENRLQTWLVKPTLYLLMSHVIFLFI